ncbi:alpha/beta hydrolase [Actinokineospora sp. 24-640]
MDLLVLLNAMTPSPGEAPGDWWANTGYAEATKAQEHDGVHPDDDTFFSDLPPDLAAEANARLRDQSGTPFEKPWPLRAWPDVPTRFLLARQDRFFPAAFQRRTVTARLGITPDEMDGGHFVALSRPDELADRLETYRTELL